MTHSYPTDLLSVASQCQNLEGKSKYLKGCVGLFIGNYIIIICTRVKELQDLNKLHVLPFAFALGKK